MLNPVEGVGPPKWQALGIAAPLPLLPCHSVGAVARYIIL